jgi:hypothetical protein
METRSRKGVEEQRQIRVSSFREHRKRRPTAMSLKGVERLCFFSREEESF